MSGLQTDVAGSLTSRIPSKSSGFHCKKASCQDCRQSSFKLITSFWQQKATFFNVWKFIQSFGCGRTKKINMTIEKQHFIFFNRENFGVCCIDKN